MGFIFRRNKHTEPVPKIADTATLDEFLSCSREEGIDGAIYWGYEQSETVTEYVDGMDKGAVDVLCPTFGQVSFLNGTFVGVKVDDRKTLNSPMTGAIIDLADIFHRAEGIDEVRFTIASLRNGRSHKHLRTYMTYPFISAGTSFPGRDAPAKKPCLFKANVEHWSPEIGKKQLRMLATFFPVSHDMF